MAWMLMIWRRKEPGHQQPWYWPRSTSIFTASLPEGLTSWQDGSVTHIPLHCPKKMSSVYMLDEPMRWMLARSITGITNKDIRQSQIHYPNLYTYPRLGHQCGDRWPRLMVHNAYCKVQPIFLTFLKLYVLRFEIPFFRSDYDKHRWKFSFVCYFIRYVIRCIISMIFIFFLI